jgi:hypothetical protein
MTSQTKNNFIMLLIPAKDVIFILKIDMIIRMQPEAREPERSAKRFFWLPVPKAQRVVD